MATFTKLNGFVEHLAEGVHNLGSDTLKFAFSNTAPGSETPTAPTSSTAACILGNVTTVSTTNLNTVTLVNITSSQSGGTYTLDSSDPSLVMTAAGSVGPFQYVYLYNEDSTTPVDALIGYWDYGQEVTMSAGETFTVTYDASGILTIA